MPNVPEPASLFVEAIADGLALDRLADTSGSAPSSPEFARYRRLETVVQAHRRVLEESPSSLDLDLLAGEGDPGPTPILPAEAPTHWGPLRIVESIGGGGFSQVYRAVDPMLDRDVALKLIVSRSAPPEEVKRRFLAEARRLARVDHENVVTVHGAGIHEGRMGIWTDFLRGATLEELIRRDGAKDPREAALIGVDLCRALGAVHAAGLIHRDVKTSNVMRAEGGKIVLLDFGLVAVDPQVGGEASVESTGGTPLYMAPEVLQGRPATAASDVYSLGVLLYRLVSGRYPIEAPDVRKLLEAHAAGRAVPLRLAAPSAPTPFVQIVEKALSRDPADRYPTAAAMELALAGFVNPDLPMPEPRPLRWKPIAAAAVSLALAAWIVLPRIIVPDFELNPHLYLDRGGRAQEIFQGEEVLAGDQVYLTVKPTRAAYAYVLNQDPQGNLVRLFPLPDPGSDSPLAAHADQALPPPTATEERRWQVGSRSGTESFLLLASAARNPWLDQALANIPPAVVETPAERGDLAAVPDTGKAITVVRQRSAAPSGALADLLRLVEEERTRGENVISVRYDLDVAGRER